MKLNLLDGIAKTRKLFSGVSRKKAAACFFALPVLLCAESRTGGVAFRFDDNKSVEVWSELHSVFRRHDFPYCLAVNSGTINPKQAAHLRKIAKDGCEIMDHTPNHSAQQYLAPSRQDAEEMKKLPFVHHVKGRMVYFKYQPNRKTNEVKLTVSVKNKKLADITPGDRSKLFYNALLEFPDGRIFGVLPRGQELLLQDFWGNPPGDLPDMDRITVKWSDRHAYDVHPEGTRFLARKSAENFRKNGLPTPVSYIIPGGWGIFNSADVIRKIYIDEFKYKNGDRGRGRECIVYGEDEFARACMEPCWISLEDESVESAEKRIANAVACRKILIFISHLNARKVRGGIPALLKKNDALLAWLKEKKIPVHTQAEWSDLVFGGKYDPEEEIFPSLKTDLNHDGIPDGFTVGKDAAVKENAVTGSGRLLTLNQLTGFVRKTNVLTFDAEGKKGTLVGVDVIVYQGSPKHKKTTVFRKRTDLHGKQGISLDIPLNADSTAVDFRFHSTGKVTLKNFSFRLK